jgi:ferredoxin
MRAIVDPDTCTGCGLCVDACPQVYEMGDASVAIVIADPIGPEAAEAAREAADQCPVEAIRIEG